MQQAKMPSFSSVLGKLNCIITTKTLRDGTFFGRVQWGGKGLSTSTLVFGDFLIYVIPLVFKKSTFSKSILTSNVSLQNCFNLMP